jgi:hypothetical protein
MEHEPPTLDWGVQRAIMWDVQHPQYASVSGFDGPPSPEIDCLESSFGRLRQTIQAHSSLEHKAEEMTKTPDIFLYHRSGVRRQLIEAKQCYSV